MKKLDIKIKDLENPEYKPILTRAQQRIEEAIHKGKITQQHKKTTSKFLLSQ